MRDVNRSLESTTGPIVTALPQKHVPSKPLQDREREASPCLAEVLIRFTTLLRAIDIANAERGLGQIGTTKSGCEAAPVLSSLDAILHLGDAASRSLSRPSARCREEFACQRPKNKTLLRAKNSILLADKSGAGPVVAAETSTPSQQQSR